MGRTAGCVLIFDKNKESEMAMNSQLLAVVQHIESERGVSREIVLTAIE